jgi:plasmid maintenance system antidote protein VapI
MTQVEIGAAIKSAFGDISISEAARRMGVARPGLSNLIAGKVRLTKAMASKLADEFPLDGEALIRDQGTVDAGTLRETRDAAATVEADIEWKRNAADYHDITSTDIARWAEKRANRAIASDWPRSKAQTALPIVEAASPPPNIVQLRPSTVRHRPTG